jgi:hypothetical protein
MSSIAYVTDEKMIEYHRLCGAREMNFWRLSSKKDFTDFRKGDLLFFYARAPHTRRKGFVGYAHYVSTRKLSLHQMWKKYRTLNGYDSEQLLSEAIHRAAKDRPVPEQMNCLYLNDAVFFNVPVDPREVGISISENLESYMYLDQEDAQTTVRILHKAEENGIDLWSASQSFEPENVFRSDEIRHQLTLIHGSIGACGWNARERSRAVKLARDAAESSDWEYIRGSHTDLVRMNRDELEIALPFAAQAKDRSVRVQEYLGRVFLYRQMLKDSGLRIHAVRFTALYEEAPADILSYLKAANYEE